MVLVHRSTLPVLVQIAVAATVRGATVISVGTGWTKSGTRYVVLRDEDPANSGKNCDGHWGVDSLGFYTDAKLAREPNGFYICSRKDYLIADNKDACGAAECRGITDTCEGWSSSMAGSDTGYVGVDFGHNHVINGFKIKQKKGCGTSKVSLVHNHECPGGRPCTEDAGNVIATFGLDADGGIFEDVTEMWAKTTTTTTTSTTTTTTSTTTSTTSTTTTTTTLFFEYTCGKDGTDLNIPSTGATAADFERAASLHSTHECAEMKFGSVVDGFHTDLQGDSGTCQRCASALNAKYETQLGPTGFSCSNKTHLKLGTTNAECLARVCLLSGNCDAKGISFPTTPSTSPTTTSTQLGCLAGEFRCSDNSKCVNGDYKCDSIGAPDCADGSDEVYDAAWPECVTKCLRGSTKIEGCPVTTTTTVRATTRTSTAAPCMVGLEYRDPDGACIPCTVCSASEFEWRACSGPNNRQCTAVSDCSASKSMGSLEFYQTAPATSTSDAVCSGITKCFRKKGSRQEYESVPPTATSDRECNRCTRICPDGEEEDTECSETADTICKLRINHITGKSEADDITGPVVGAVLGVGVIIAAVIVYRKKTNPVGSESQREISFVNPVYEKGVPSSALQPPSHVGNATKEAAGYSDLPVSPLAAHAGSLHDADSYSPGNGDIANAFVAVGANGYMDIKAASDHTQADPESDATFNGFGIDTKSKTRNNGNTEAGGGTSAFNGFGNGNMDVGSGSEEDI